MESRHRTQDSKSGGSRSYSWTRPLRLEEGRVGAECVGLVGTAARKPNDRQLKTIRATLGC
jgi:hypothetical protein